MALIRCPECGQSVSSEAPACPHCGYPIKSFSSEVELNKETIVENTVQPLDSAWLDAYKSKPAIYKTILTLIFLINVVLVVCLLVGGLYFVGVIFGFLSFFTFFIWIVGLICIKTKTIEESGYHAIAISGVFRNSLVVENVVQEIGNNRHLDGKFPNGKHVWADFSIWDSDITISVDIAPFNERRH